MQIFEQKSSIKMLYLYTLQNTIFQRSLFLLGNAERCVQRSCFFRLKVRGERRLAIGYKAKVERCGLAALPLTTLLAEEQKM